MKTLQVNQRLHALLGKTFLFSALLLGLAAPASAVPVISNDFAFTENFGPNAAGFPTGHYLHVGATVTDGDVPLPSGITSVTATNGSSTIALPFQSLGSAVSSNYEYFAPYTGETGIWSITATNSNSATASTVTHNLDDIHIIPLATGITFSDFSTTPLISWNPVFFDDDGDANTADVEVDRYRIRLLNATSDQFFQSSNLTGTSFQLPDFILTPGDSIFVRIMALDFDLTEGAPGQRPLENRSSTFVQFTASSVPEPGTVALFAIGLVGFLATRQRRRGVTVA